MKNLMARIICTSSSLSPEELCYGISQLSERMDPLNEWITFAQAFSERRQSLRGRKIRPDLCPSSRKQLCEKNLGKASKWIDFYFSSTVTRFQMPFCCLPKLAKAIGATLEGLCFLTSVQRCSWFCLCLSQQKNLRS